VLFVFSPQFQLLVYETALQSSIYSIISHFYIFPGLMRLPMTFTNSASHVDVSVVLFSLTMRMRHV
jgi:hypothetical protein